MKTLTTKEIVEFFAENKDKFKYDESGNISNVTYLTDDIFEMGMFNCRGKYVYPEQKQKRVKGFNFIDAWLFTRGIYELSIIEPTYKPYSQVETWMLGKELKYKYNGKIFKIFSITYNNRIGLQGTCGQDTLEYLFDNYTNLDNLPFGQEVV